MRFLQQPRFKRIQNHILLYSLGTRTSPFMVKVLVAMLSFHSPSLHLDYICTPLAAIEQPSVILNKYICTELIIAANCA